MRPTASSTWARTAAGTRWSFEYRPYETAPHTRGRLFFGIAQGRMENDLIRQGRFQSLPPFRIRNPAPLIPARDYRVVRLQGRHSLPQRERLAAPCGYQDIRRFPGLESVGRGIAFWRAATSGMEPPMFRAAAIGVRGDAPAAAIASGRCPLNRLRGSRCSRSA